MWEPKEYIYHTGKQRHISRPGGFLFLISTSATQRYIRVFYNEQGEFNNFSDFSLESDATFSGINHGKVNDDDYDDIVVISNNGHFWGILYNDGNSGFTSPEYFNLDGPPSDIACSDLNKDGRDDVVVVGNKLNVYYSYDTSL
ncbi:MAG: VCBS repeat-containing protein [Bacteroidales bacterium]